MTLLCLGPSSVVGPTKTASHAVATASEEDAARLHELLRLAALNARGMAKAPPTRWPVLRSTLLVAPAPTISRGGAAVRDAAPPVAGAAAGRTPTFP